MSDGVSGLCGIVAEDLDRSRRGPSQPQDQVQGGRLSCAVRAQEAHDLTRGNIKGDNADCTFDLSRPRGVSLDEVLDVDSGGTHW